MRFWAFIALGFLIGLTGISLHAKADEKRQALFGEMVGLNVKYSQGEPQNDLPLLNELGVKWVRDTVGWPEVEPVAGQYKAFPQKYQDRLKFYKENNIGVVFLLCYANTKAYPDSPENPYNSVNPEAYGRYAVEAAKLLKASGVRFVLEIWNEPHNFVLKKQLGGEWNAKTPSPWVDHYLKMVSESVKQVKAYDPDVKLIDDDDMWVIHYWFLEKGLPKNLDGFGFHPYSGSVGPETTAVGQEANWIRPFAVVDADRSFKSAMRRLREQSVTKLGKVPAMWATEWGWAVGEKSISTALTPDAKVTPEAVAAYLPRAFITSAACGVENLCWFSSYDSGDGPMGLRSNDRKHRPAFNAFKTMTQQLSSMMLDGQILGSDHPTTGVQGYLFRSQGASKLVLWNIDGEATFLVNGKVDESIHIVDGQGKEVPIGRTADGRLKLVLKQAPIYVVGLPVNLSLEAAPSPVAAPPTFLFR